MNNRTMIKLSASEDCITLRTFSKEYHSPQGFIFLEKDLLELEEKRYMTVSDIRSFAKLALRKTMEQGNILEISFTWLRDIGREEVAGRTETVRLSYEKFKAFVKESRERGIQLRVLSLEEHTGPKIEFQSRRNLKAVAETKALRKKLGKFLGKHFLRWQGSRQITVYDDFEPYSFFFQEQTPYGSGMCGGVILHGRENLEKAYYGIHT
ncbi:hypothetical protein DFR60_10473 [Hungatella effluvii]|uniref:Uncharacterized protein n=1 Tax=Hungatella effluvii TaxID=1096246 RepID=A0A2V3Y6E8_9FIRM|nr:hypothetical protein [Hungatella effluvii]PXX54248.1 hypothetical protein DFR60_10473 [Hungatella effluvii]